MANLILQKSFLCCPHKMVRFTDDESLLFAVADEATIATAVKSISDKKIFSVTGKGKLKYMGIVAVMYGSDSKLGGSTRYHILKVVIDGKVIGYIKITGAGGTQYSGIRVFMASNYKYIANAGGTPFLGLSYDYEYADFINHGESLQTLTAKSTSNGSLSGVVFLPTPENKLEFNESVDIYWSASVGSTTAADEMYVTYDIGYVLD